MSKKLSIIVPVYNMAAEGKLNYCLDSLVGQTIRGLYDYEILCVDDASTDDSLEILLDYEKRYPELVRILPNRVNLRQGGAKNEALKVAEGEWIGFIDSDDWVSPDYYEKLLKKAEETGADVVGCDYSLVDHHTFEVGKVIVNNTPDQTGELTEEQHKSLFIRPGSMVLKIYKHSVIRENRLDFPAHIFYEDNCAGPLWSLYFRHFARVEEPLYYYYQHAVSTVHHITEDKCRDRMKAAELLYVSNCPVFDSEAYWQQELQGLLRRIDEKDHYTQRHSRAVMEYALQLYKELKDHCPGLKLEDFVMGALFHDVGKCNVPGDILRKKARLTDEEYKLIQQHPLDSARLLEPIYGPRIAELAYSHHERMDGRGYPRGLKGEEIPFEARILAVADAFDAMTSDRGYNRVKTFEEAAVELQSLPEAYDPLVTATLVRLVREGRIGPQAAAKTAE